MSLKLTRIDTMSTCHLSCQVLSCNSLPAIFLPTLHSLHILHCRHPPRRFSTQISQAQETHSVLPPPFSSPFGTAFFRLISRVKSRTVTSRSQCGCAWRVDLCHATQSNSCQ